MDSAHQAEPEDLDELPLDHLRDLTLEEPEAEGAPPHVASAPGSPDAAATST